jgi:hypothetical protein
MHKLIKPLLLTSMLVLPVLGVANASPIWASHDDPASLREQLRSHQVSYDTAMANNNFERARFEKDQIDITRAKLDQAELTRRWDLENSEDYHLMVDPDTYYIHRTVITTTPGMTRIYDPITETYHFVRVYP